MGPQARAEPDGTWRPGRTDLTALSAQSFVWDEIKLGNYLKNPKSVVGKGKMVFVEGRAGSEGCYRLSEKVLQIAVTALKRSASDAQVMCDAQETHKCSATALDKRVSSAAGGCSRRIRILTPGACAINACLSASRSRRAPLRLQLGLLIF
jgi:hypothetical protein